MRDVRIIAYRIFPGRRVAELIEAQANLRAVHNAGEPRRLVLEDGEKLVHPRAGEALRRDPHLRLRVILLEVRGLLFQQGHQLGRLRVTGVAAGDEDGIDARQLLENLAPFLERMGDRLRIAVVRVQGGIPDPHVEAILIGQPGHADHHLHRRQREMGAVGRVVGARRNQLDGIGAEDGEIADVLLPHRQRPAVEAVRLGPIAELMPAQGNLWNGGNANIGRQRGPVFRQLHLAQEIADTEEDAAGIVPRNTDGGHVPIARRPNAIALRLTAAVRPGAHQRVERSGAAHGNDCRRLIRPLVGTLPTNLRAFLDLVDQHRDRLFLGAGQLGRSQHDRSRQIERAILGEGDTRVGGEKKQCD